MFPALGATSTELARICARVRATLGRTWARSGQPGARFARVGPNSAEFGPGSTSMLPGIELNFATNVPESADVWRGLDKLLTRHRPAWADFDTSAAPPRRAQR